jgi:hypothetical protein
MSSRIYKERGERNFMNTKFSELLLDPTIWTYARGGEKYYACHDLSGCDDCGCCGGGRCCDDEDHQYPIVRTTPSTLTLDIDRIDFDIADGILKRLTGKTQKISVVEKFMNSLKESSLKGDFIFGNHMVNYDSEMMEDGSGNVIVVYSDMLFLYNDNEIAKNFFTKLFELYEEVAI